MAGNVSKAMATIAWIASVIVNGAQPPGGFACTSSVICGDCSEQIKI
jgi:hypothetical protein